MNRDEERKREAERILRGVERDTMSIAESNVPKQIEERLFDTKGKDAVERWGRIIGRSLGFLFLLYLVWHLANTYLF